jgi:hypothetical protein
MMISMLLVTRGFSFWKYCKFVLWDLKDISILKISQNANDKVCWLPSKYDCEDLMCFELIIGQSNQYLELIISLLIRWLTWLSKRRIRGNGGNKMKWNLMILLLGKINIKNNNIYSNHESKILI